VKIDKGQVGIMVLGGGHGVVGIVRNGDNPISGVILDEIFQGRR
jgi:hypothetical protein